MSRTDHVSFTHHTSPSTSSSRSTSKARPANHGHVFQPTVALNVLFVGETNMGDSSIIGLVAGSGEQTGDRDPSHHDDVRSIALDGKTFMLHATPTNESMSTATVRQEIQNTLTDLGRNGGVHLLVYCMNTLHSIKWVCEIHRAVVSYPTPSPRIPAVAVVAGMSDVTEQERWWSNNGIAFTEQGLRFDDYAFIRMMTTGGQSFAGDYISESRHALHALILRRCHQALNSETDSDFHSGKLPSLTFTASKAIDVVLLGEIGVGKSSLINLIAGEDIAEVSSDTVGCTKAAVKYTFEEKGRTFHLYDTPGLVDPLMGVKPFIDPIDSIRELICSLGNGTGPDLLLFCIDKPTAALERNYHLFCNIICRGKVSFALAITRLEEGQDADEWLGQHKPMIRKYGIDCSRYIGIRRGKRHLGPNADLEVQSRESLLSFFVDCTRMNWLRSSAKRMAWFIRSQVSTPERVLVKRCGLEKQTARELASRLGPTKL